MILTDTHTHLYYETDEQELANKMQRCFEAGVNRLFLPNVDLTSSVAIQQMVSSYPANCFAMMGLHPCEVKEDYQAILSKMRILLAEQQYYAIGEIGIDLYWDKNTVEIQKDAFAQQINWAKELDLPFVIHCREAFDEVFEVLEALHHPKMRGIFHCFTGDATQAKRAIDLGFYLGIGGVVTYKKAGLDITLQQIDLKHLVLETDSPYLAPVPYRGKTNESSYLVYIAQKIADIYGYSIKEIADITTENSKLIFGI